MIIPLLAQGMGLIFAALPLLRRSLATFHQLSAIAASLPSSSLLIASAPAGHRWHD